MTRLENRSARLRQIENLLLLNPQGLSAIDLAQQLYIDRRTIYRDLDFLSTQGVPVWQGEGRFGIQPTRYLATVRLTFHEAMALALAGLMLSRALDERQPHVIAALRRLAVTLPPPLTASLERAATRVGTRPENAAQVAVLEILTEAWATGHKVRIGYRSPSSGQLRERVLSPYTLEPATSGIYVIGQDDWANAIRTFKLERLESAQLLDETFAIPEDFDPEVYLATSWGIMAGDHEAEVVLRFTAQATPYVRERRWHASQQVELAADGGCILRVKVSEPQEMQPWIRSWGSQVEVLEPAGLRQSIAEELCRAMDLYRCEGAQPGP
jgi:proteasome accessory factor B